MINEADIEVGLLIWWTANRTFNSWDTPGVITYVNREENKYRVFTFDDMKETDELEIIKEIPPCGCGDPSSLTKMRISFKEEIIRYLQNQNIKHAQKIKDCDNMIENLNKEINHVRKTITQIENGSFMKKLLGKKNKNESII